MKRVLYFLHESRYLMLGIGLAGLHTDDFVIRTIYVIIAGAAIIEINHADR